MQKYRIVYFKRSNGEMPASEWIKKRDGSVRANVRKRLEVLQKEGLNLKGTKSLVPLSGDTNFYELRNLTFKWRIGLYYDPIFLTFVLFHGWNHDENHEEEHQKEIEKARAYLYEYLTMEKDTDV